MTMTIRRHKDGTHSITGLTSADMENLSHGMLDAECSLLAMSPAKLDNDHAYIARTAAKYRRLADALRAVVEDSSGHGLYGRPVRRELTSDNYHGNPEHLAYVPD